MQIFIVVKQQQELLVYHVQNLKNPKDVRILLRNHLMNCEQLEEDVFEDEEEETTVKKNTRLKSHQREILAKKVKSGNEDIEEETNVRIKISGSYFIPHQCTNRVRGLDRTIWMDWTTGGGDTGVRSCGSGRE